MTYDNRDVARFHRLINKDGECWLWKAAKDRDGYGFFKLGRKQVKAHRFMWRLLNGPIPSGIFICHHCDNPSCVRPDHLFAGTHQDNKDDQVRKGRQPRGEQMPASKLTADMVREIRFLAETTNITQTALSKKFGIAQPNIGKIINGKAWHAI